jgi:hypothetical protein
MASSFAAKNRRAASSRSSRAWARTASWAMSPHAHLRLGQQQAAQADDAQQGAGGVHDGQEVDRLGLLGALAHMREGFADGLLGVQREHLRGHVAADRVARVAEHRGGHGPLVGVQPAQEPLGDGGGQLVEQQGAVVGVEVADDVGDLRGAQRGDQLGLVLRGERLEDGERLALVEHAEQQRGLGRGAGPDQIDQLAGGQRVRFEREVLELRLALRVGAQQGEDGIEGGGGGHLSIVAESRGRGRADGHVAWWACPPPSCCPCSGSR